MKKIYFALVLFVTLSAKAQNPIPLFPDIYVNKVMTVQDGSVRLCYSKIDHSFYYLALTGEIYKIIQQGSTFTDSLIANASDHGIQACQGMVIKDSTIFVSGNNDKDSTYTTGHLMKGVLQSNNTRVWSVVAETVPYLTSGPFDHWISGLGINKTADTLFLCSGSRGDHGEVNDVSGQFPGTRNLALTSCIFQIPVDGNNIIIPNDSSALDAQQLIYARGIRNTFDFAFNAAGDMFGAENSGDRDAEDELNWLQHGHHYGFPWMLGGSENPQQYSWFNPSADPLINHNAAAWIRGLFTNDSLFPQKPLGLITDLPCKNEGAAAAYMRDSANGQTYNAGANGQSIYSFTPHRSPLGLVFDVDSVLGGMYNGNGYVLSYTRGDSTISGFSKLLVPFGDPSEDLTMMVMTKDISSQTYSFQSTKIVSNFKTPIDAVQLDTSIYVMETGYGGTASLWRIDFPRKITGIQEHHDDQFIVYPNPCYDVLNIHFNQRGTGNTEIKIYDISGRVVKNITIKEQQSIITIPVNLLKAGAYLLELKTGDNILNTKFCKTE